MAESPVYTVGGNRSVDERGNREATDAHEPLTRARGGSITDPGNVLALCRWCHERAHRENRLEHSWDAR